MRKKIKALVMDVDGTLTDGSIYIGENGEIMKRFYVRDGQAIKHFLPRMGIIPIIITGRISEIVLQRCQELDICHLVQGSGDKLSDLKVVLNTLDITLEETAYIGDDVNDLECMQAVGVCACPCDADQSVVKIAHIVTRAAGGYGTVREFIEWLGEK